jgi:hypothetical protein
MIPLNVGTELYGYHLNSELNVKGETAYFGLLDRYNHDRNINDTNELQICKGKFRTPLNASLTKTGYFNYREFYGNTNNGMDYFNVTYNNNYKYAMFGWNIYASSSVVKSIKFRIKDIEGNVITKYLGGSNYAYGTNELPIEIYYRVANITNPVPVCDPYSTIETSTWININSNMNFINRYNYNNPKMAGEIGSMISFTNNTNEVIFDSGIMPFVTFQPNMVYMYCLIGLPINSNISFSGITLELIEAE